MSVEVQAHVFGAFYTTKGINGTGLGLWISRRIAHKHRGLLRSRSVESRGTVFCLWLLWPSKPAQTFPGTKNNL